MNNKQPIATTFLAAFCLTLLLLLASCDEVPLDIFDQLENTPEIGAVDTNLIAANTAFGFNLFNEIRKTEQNKNIFISPFSVSVALAMTLNGAANETEQEMMNVLQLQGLSSESINAGYGQLQHKLQASDPKVTLTLANSLWARQGIQFKQDFLQRNIQFFGAEISTLDFDDPSASQIINQWVNTNTNGKIQKIVSDTIDPATVLFLINAIYFKGTWQREFDSSKTEDGTFYLTNGDEKQVPMMKQQRQHPYYRGQNFQAISLAYGDGQISMYIFLPDRESNLNTFLANLHAEGWENWMSQFHKQDVSLVMPKFKLEYEKTLNDTLNMLGMGRALKPELANFSRMAPLEVAGVNLYIEKVVHKAFVEVNEEGTAAAAATSVEVGITSLPPPPIPFTVDRPFFFAIRDNHTKTVLFMGIVMEP